MSDDLWRAYRSTLIDVTLPDTAVRRIRQREQPTGDKWPFTGKHAWILTACNPRSEQLSDDDNLTRHRELGGHLVAQGLTVLPNVGYSPTDPTWSEPGYTVLGCDRAYIIATARSWEQNAIFGWYPDHWEIIGVLMAVESVHGWRWD